MDASVETLRHLSEKLNAECVELRRRQENNGYIADLLVRERADERDFIEVRSVITKVWLNKITHHWLLGNKLDLIIDPNFIIGTVEV